MRTVEEIEQEQQGAERTKLTTYKVYAESYDGRRRYIDTSRSNGLGSGLFDLYQDDCNDDEDIVIIAIN